MKRGKRYQELVKSYDKSQLYDFKEAIAMVKKMANTKFDESIELHVRLGVDSRHADQQVRGALVLPHGTGKTVKVLVVAKGDKLQEAEEAGADYFGEDEYLEKINNEGWYDFDVMITTPDMMGKVVHIGSVHGPKGLMPNPKSGTVTTDIKKAVEDVKAGKVEYRLDKSNIMHVMIGKASFTEEQLLENLNVLLDAVKKAKPPAAKGQYFRSVTLTSTMGPGVKLNVASIAKTN